MAGYGASLAFDEKAMQALPIGRDKESTVARRQLFRQADMNGNGITSLAECDRLIVAVLNIEGLKIMKPVINRAFHAARDIVPACGAIGPHYVDFHEFRYFLIYLKHYLELFLIFAGVDQKDHTGKYSDRRMSYPEFEAALPKLIEWGLEDETLAKVREDPRLVYQDLDANGGGVVLFDEFAHWALWNHLFKMDGDDDADMEEALEVLRKQKPNLCGKDLTSIKASKAKYRADAKISGQGCLGGDPSLSGGYEKVPDGGKELAEGRHYPGGLAAWKASFHGAGKDRPGMYRTVAQITAIYRGIKKSDGKVDQIPSGGEVEVLEILEVPEANRVRARIDRGFISLLNTENGFRWAVRLPDKKGSKGASESWRSSFDRCAEANADFVTNGVPECVNGCGQPRFGRFPTCCWHCKGPDGPHARDCVPQGYAECENGCGHPQFGKYKTCCTHCKGADGPHARGCKSAKEEKQEATCNSRSKPIRETGPACGNACGRQPFRKYPTCCTRCKGADGPHHPDCDQRVKDEKVRRDIRNIFNQAKDTPSGLSHGRFRQLLQKLFPGGGIEDMIAVCDKNRNGTIEIDEFLDWMWSTSVTEDTRNDLQLGATWVKDESNA